MNDQNELFQNGSVTELLAILREQGMNEAIKDMLGALTTVSAMDRRLEVALAELRGMKQELAGMREEANHPLKTSCQNAIRSLEAGIADMRERISALKTHIEDAVKSAIKAFKENGVSALCSALGFLGVRDDLRAWQNELQQKAKASDKAIAKVEAVSSEYHELGKSVRNLGRAIIGKERAEDVKPTGQLAKLAKAPHRTAKSLYNGMEKHVSRAVSSLERLERSAKPSLLAGMAAMKPHPRKQPEPPAADKEKAQAVSI
jgi:regulator of replication initiation timing